MTELGALRLQDRPAWRAKILAALDDSGGSRTLAAKACGVSQRQFARWVREIGLAPAKPGPRIAHGKPGKPQVEAKGGQGKPQDLQDHDTRVMAKTSKKLADRG